jgi:hypothetical protein
MSEGGRYLDRQPDVNKRSLAAAIEPPFDSSRISGIWTRCRDDL